VIAMTFLSIAMSAKAQDLTGGIIYSDGKNAFFQDFTGNKASLATGTKATQIKEAVAVSVDGSTLFWSDRSKLWKKVLPDGEASYTTYERGKPTAKKGSAASSPPADTRNLNVSSDGRWISFETTRYDIKWVLMEEGAGLDQNVNGTPTNFAAYPFYAVAPDFCNAIVVMPSPGNKGVPEVYGNTAYIPPTFPIRATWQDLQMQPTAELILLKHRTTQSLKISGIYAAERDVHRMFSIKRNARFPTWSKNLSGRPLIAFIYQSEIGWGPIEIRDPTSLPIASFKRGAPIPATRFVPGTKPGIWEIPILLKTCDGLDWGKDGSLACLTGGMVVSFSSQEILRGIEASDIGREYKPNCDNVGPRHWPYIPLNNMIQVQQKTIATGVIGDQFRWIAEKTFLFRNRTLLVWNDGKVNELCQAPMNFSYCLKAPPNITATPKVAASTNKPADAVVSR
jgi:hypothetical protein